MEQKKKIPFLLGVTLYGLLVLLVVLLLGIIMVLLNVQQFNFLNESYSLQSSEYGSITLVYLPLLFILLSIYSVIQILRRKHHALYIFMVLSILLLVLLLFQNPIDGLNIIFILLVNFILLLYGSWFKQKDLSEDPKNLNIVSKTEED